MCYRSRGLATSLYCLSRENLYDQLGGAATYVVVCRDGAGGDELDDGPVYEVPLGPDHGA